MKALSRNGFYVSMLAVLAATIDLGVKPLYADGFLKGSADYEGSLEERSQEAIIVMTSQQQKAMEELILKIFVEGETEKFAWVIPFPTQPQVTKADAVLFKELFDYVQQRAKAERKTKAWKHMAAGGFGGVDVLSREVVGSYDVAVVREDVAGTLNQWLEKEGYQPIEDGEDVLDFYRKKNYVFACIKVSEAKLGSDEPVDLHPLRFTFLTGGRDGIYFPMKMTGLQKESFSVNLYVFYRAWLNDRLNRFGYMNGTFDLKYRDWDTARCRPNAGKRWNKPGDDPFLRTMANHIPTVSKMFAERYPGQSFYLTNIYAPYLEPATVRQWPNDLWLFPYYLDRQFVPYDARPGGVAESN